jgi:purine-binding chemotaxis protein CheW
MGAEGHISLPACGLAEDILSRFIDQAQVEADNTVAPVAGAKGETLFHLVTFRLGKEEYGVEIKQVQEIIRAADITPVPGAPAHVRGVINLRGKIIPVVDLRRRFGLPAVEESEERRIVVVEVGDKRLGMLVDSVSQVIKFSSSVMEEMPEEAVTLGENYIRGMGKLDDRLIFILDLNGSLLLKQQR